MSQHPSLKMSSAGTEQPSVLKRLEKLKILQEKKPQIHIRSTLIRPERLAWRPRR